MAGEFSAFQRAFQHLGSASLNFLQVSQRYGKTTREPIEFCSLSFHLESETVFQGVLKTYKLNLTRHIEMEQKQGGVHYGIETSTSQSGISFSNREVSAELQKDFSVTNRLLSPYNVEGKEFSKSSHPDIYPSCYPHGWQYLLPTDQGSVSAPRSGWQGIVPNTSIHTLPKAAPLADGSSPYGAAAPSYSVQNSHMHNSSGEHIAGLTTPLHHAADVKQVNAISPPSPSNDQRKNGKQIPDTRSSSTGTSRHTSRSRSGTEEPGDDLEGENFSGEESDGESSLNSHSSHGGGAYIEEPKKPKRTRTAYSNNQLDQLELVFSQTQYPDVFLREELAKTLGIKEDRIQVWFQNRRARYRKQERTGSVSFRSRYRQRRLKVLQQSHAMSSIYPGYMSTASQGSSSTMLLQSPQPMASYMSNFHYPAQVHTASAGIAPSSSAEPLTPTSTTGHLPGFHTLRPAPMHLPNYVSRAVPSASLSSRPPYTTLHTGGVVPTTGQKS